MKKILGNKKNLVIGLILGCIILICFGIYFFYRDHMLISRQNFTATLLKNNTVLVVGGRHNNKQTDSAEIYNPKTHFSHFVGKLNIPRESHKAILLADGRVLIAGGRNDELNFIQQAEIYNPKTDKFTLTDELKVNGLINLTLSKLNNGKIFVAGGGGSLKGGIRKSNEIYDPKTNKFSFAAFSIIDHIVHTANVLQNGNVLIAGGDWVSDMRKHTKFTTEIYDYKANKFIQGPDMLIPRIQFNSIALKDGRILKLGGDNPHGGTALNTEIYDPNLNKFEYAGTMKKDRFYNLEPVLLNDGRVYIVGSDYYPILNLHDNTPRPTKSTCEIYNPTNQTFKFTDICINPVTRGHIPILLQNGELLLFGGWYVGIPNELQRKIEIINTGEIK